MDPEPEPEPKLDTVPVTIMLGGVQYTVVDKDGLKTAVNADGKTFALSDDETVATQVVIEGETAETYVKDLDSGEWVLKPTEAVGVEGGRRSRRRRSNKKKMSKGWGGSKKKKQKKRKGSKKRR
jgi:hypothetical protein